MDWLPSNARVIATHGWAGRLFAIVEDSEGFGLIFPDGRAVRSGALADLLVHLSEAERLLVAFDSQAATASDRFVRVANLVRGAQFEDARELALDGLVELLSVTGEVEPELHPVPGDARRWIARCFVDVSRLIRQGEAERAAVRAREGLLALADVVGGERTRWEQSVREPSVIDRFLWPAQPADVTEAVDAIRSVSAGSIATVDGVWSDGTDATYRHIELCEAVRHPMGVDVSVIPVWPQSERTENHRLNIEYRKIVNQNNRLRRLVELSAPPTIVFNERRMLREALEGLIATADASQPVRRGRPVRRALPLRPAVEGRGRPGLAWVPGHYSPAVLVVQREGSTVVVDAEGTVLHALPPTPMRAAWGDKDHVVFVGRVVSGPVLEGVAVLELATGRWLDAWPAALHFSVFIEHDDFGNHWVVDPTIPASRPLAGVLRAYSPGGGMAWMETSEGDRLVGLTDPGALPIEPADAAPFGFDPSEERLGEPGRLAGEIAPAVGRGTYGGKRVCWPDGTVQVEGTAVLALHGAVDAVGLEHGGDGMAVLSGDVVSLLTLPRSEEEEPRFRGRLLLASPSSS